MGCYKITSVLSLTPTAFCPFLLAVCEHNWPQILIVCNCWTTVFISNLQSQGCVGTLDFIFSAQTHRMESCRSWGDIHSIRLWLLTLPIFRLWLGWESWYYLVKRIKDHCRRTGFCTLRCCWPDTGVVLETTWALVTISPFSDITKPDPLDKGMFRPKRGCLGGEEKHQ